MDNLNLENSLKELLSDIGYELASLSFKKEKGITTLYVVVDRDEPIDLNAISEVSEKISKYLDDNDPINEAYTLDVSSLGAEKPLKLDRLASYVGKYVNIHLINPVKGENILEGELNSVIDNQVIILVRNKARLVKYETNIENISKARLAIKF